MISGCASHGSSSSSTDSEPIAPSEVRDEISSDLLNVVSNSQLTAQNLQLWANNPAAFQLVARVLGSTTPLAQAVLALSSNDAALTPIVALDPHAPVDDLNAQVFTDTAVLDDNVYPVPADALCSWFPVTCTPAVANADIRVRISRPPIPPGYGGGSGGNVPAQPQGLVYAIQIGPDHDEPVVATLSHDGIRITLDLDVLQHALDSLAATSGPHLPATALAGQVTVLFTGASTDPRNFLIPVTIDRPLAIQIAGASGSLTAGDAFALTEAAGDPLRITDSGNAIAVDVELAATDLKLPQTTGKQLEIAGAGFSTLAQFSAGGGLVLQHIGFANAPVNVSVDGKNAETIALNATIGGQIDIRVVADAKDNSGPLDAIISPQLVLQVNVDHSVLGDVAPVYDVTYVTLNGGAHADRADLTAQTGALVADGLFSLTTMPASYGFSVDSPQCVSGSQANDPTTAQSFVRWAVGACPAAPAPALARSTR